MFQLVVIIDETPYWLVHVPREVSGRSRYLSGTGVVPCGKQLGNDINVQEEWIYDVDYIAGICP
jgi:hypothetical protein